MTPASSAAKPDDDQERSLRQLGVSQADIERNRRPQQASQTFVPWAWHVDAMRLFGGMRTQWNAVTGVKGLFYIGLNYGAVRAVKEELGLLDAGPELFDQLQAIERGATTYLNSHYATST